MGQAQDNTADYWKGKASSYSSEKSYDMALESINKALNIKSDDEAALNLKGGILIGLGRFDEAVSIFDVVVSRNSKSKAAWKGKGYAFYRQGKYRDAVKCYDEALKIDDADAEALHYKGLALSQLGEKGEGEKLQERAVIIEPSYAYESGSAGLKREANLYGGNIGISGPFGFRIDLRRETNLSLNPEVSTPV
jgi:tetratricopeptide (TPR) repeat protein